MSQTDLWMGRFGDDYTLRNFVTDEMVSQRLALFQNMLTPGRKYSSIVEIGAGTGANLRALRLLLGDEARLIAVEPNESARGYLKMTGAVAGKDVLDGTAERIPFQDEAVDLAFTSGVLIHIHPDRLGAALDEIHRVSRRYIACIEYFSPNLEKVPYRGETDALWRGDYGSMFLDRHPDLASIRYGFCWKRDTGLDNVTWHLMEKTR